MDDPDERIDNEIVDLDSCSKTKSIALGAAIACLLGFVPLSYPFFLHFILGGFAAVGHFAKRHSLTLTAWQGAKLGSLATFLGMLAFYIAGPLWYLPSVPDETWEQYSEQMIEQAYAKGRPELAEMIESVELSTIVSSMLVGMFVVFLVMSLLLGSFGGMLGSWLFKRGPEAM